MKTIYKNSLYIALSTLLCVLLALPASAQHDHGGGGGGARPSSGGGGGARPSGGGFSRPSAQRSIAPQRPGNFNRAGVAPRNNGVSRGNFAPRTGVAARGNFAPRPGVSGRVGVPGGGGYRTAPAVGYGRGAAGYWGNHGYYHYSHGYYGSYYLPRLGFSIGVLPYGYYPFYFGNSQYYFSDGLYYEYNNDQYTVVEPPVGAQVTSLPSSAQSIVINGAQYYEDNGVYYQPVTKDDGTTVYQIAGKDGQLNTDATTQDQQPQGPQMGDIVSQLPSDCRKINVNGQKLYVSPDGVYYQQQTDNNNQTTYKVVGVPSDEPDQN